jgi:hypothetical protein
MAQTCQSLPNLKVHPQAIGDVPDLPQNFPFPAGMRFCEALFVSSFPEKDKKGSCIRSNHTSRLTRAAKLGDSEEGLINLQG